MGGEGPGGAWCKSNRAGMQGCSFSHLHPWTLQCHTFCPQDHPGNLLFLKSSTRPSFLPLGLLSVGALHLPEPPGGVCVGMGLGAGGRLGFDRQLGSWAALRRPPPPARPPIPAGSRREAGVGATSQGNFCSCPEQTQAGDRASPWLPRRPGPLEFMFIFTVWIPWT